MGWWEMDLFKLTNSGYIYEYEVKISRSDFFNDFKKRIKGSLKHNRFKEGNCTCNRFFFVVPQNLIKVEEIPAYAGLIYFLEDRRFHLIKNAPLIHKNKVKDNIYKQLAHSLSFREAIYRYKVRECKEKNEQLKKSTCKPHS